MRMTGWLGWMAALLAFAAPATAAAQDSIDAPPVRETVDKNGVDLVGGGFTTSATDVSIGPSGSHGLAYTRYWSTDGWLDSTAGAISGSSSNPVVTLGGGSDSFTLQGGTYVPDQGNGVTLTVDGGSGDYLYTGRDGTVARFTAVAGDTFMYYGPYSNIGLIKSVAYPDGVVVSFAYKTNTQCEYSDEFSFCFNYLRLQSASSNLGYMLKVGYQSNDLNDVGAWSIRSTVTAINTNVDGCDPSADSCSLAHGWPSATYDAFLPTAVTDPAGRTWRYDYDGSSRLTGIRRPGASSDDVTIGYDGNGRVHTIDRIGATWTYSYVDNGSDQTTTTTNPDNSQRSVVIDTTIAEPVTATDETGRATGYRFSLQGLLAQVTHQAGNAESYFYDDRGNVTLKAYLPVSNSGLSNVFISAGYDASCANPAKCNKPNWTQDAAGNETDYTYDAGTGLVTSVTGPAVATTAGTVRPQVRYGYTASGGVTVLTSTSMCRTTSSCAGTADEVKTTIGYGANLLPTSVSKGAGDGSLTATVTTGYDNVGNQVSVTNPLGATTVMRYDASRALLGVVGPDPDGSGPLTPQAVKYSYDPSGLLQITSTGTVTDQSDAAWSNYAEAYHSWNGFDAYGRVIRQTLSSNGTDYAVSDVLYDGLGRPSCTIVYMDPAQWGPQASTCTPLQTNGPNGPDRVTQTGYDAAGRVVQVTQGVGTAAASTERKSYTPNGATANVTDANNNTTDYGYDGLGRLSKTTYPSPSSPGNLNFNDYEELGYDAAGRVNGRRLRDGNLIQYGYDALGRLTSRSPANQRGVAYQYDLLGELTQAAYDYIGGPDAVTFVYDGLGRATSSTTSMSGTSRTVSYLHDLAGNETRVTHPDGVYFTMAYDGVDRLSSFYWWTPATGTVPFGHINYDNLGRRTETARASSTTSYGYDAISRLNALGQNFAGGAGNGSDAFTYYPSGQIATHARYNDDYGWAGAVNVDRSYAANGLNQYTSAGPATFSYDGRGNLTSDGTNSWSYDLDNRLVSASTSQGTTLTYDPLGRLWRTASPVYGKTDFVYDGSHVAVEYDGDTGGIRRRFFWGPGADEPILEDTNQWLNCSETRFLHTDERGSVVALADCYGNRQAVNTYDEHGIPGSSNQGRYQYTGQAWIADLGMYYYKARIYSPTLGRFLQTDPIGYADGLNWYGYAHGDPVNGTDPDGTDSCIDGGALCDVVVTANPTPPADTYPGTVDIGGGYSGSGGGEGGGGTIGYAGATVTARVNCMLHPTDSRCGYQLPTYGDGSIGLFPPGDGSGAGDGPQNANADIDAARHRGICRLKVGLGIALDIGGTIAGAIPGTKAALVATQLAFAGASELYSIATHNGSGVGVAALGAGLTGAGLSIDGKLAESLIPGVAAVTGAIQTAKDIKSANEDYASCASGE